MNAKESVKEKREAKGRKKEEVVEKRQDESIEEENAVDLDLAILAEEILAEGVNSREERGASGPEEAEVVVDGDGAADLNATDESDVEVAEEVHVQIGSNQADDETRGAGDVDGTESESDSDQNVRPVRMSTRIRRNPKMLTYDSPGNPTVVGGT